MLQLREAETFRGSRTPRFPPGSSLWFPAGETDEHANHPDGGIGPENARRAPAWVVSVFGCLTLCYEMKRNVSRLVYAECKHSRAAGYAAVEGLAARRENRGTP